MAGKRGGKEAATGFDPFFSPLGGGLDPSYGVGPFGGGLLGPGWTGPGAQTFFDPFWAPSATAGTRRRLSAPPAQAPSAGGGGAGAAGKEGEAPGEGAGEGEGEQKHTREPYVVGSAGWTRSIPVDFIEREKEYVVRADIPGVRKTEIYVDVHPPAAPGEGAVLRFGHNPYAEREKEDIEEPGIFHRAERVTTFRNRNLRLPEDADAERVQQASYEDGVLQVIIPKKEMERAPGRVLAIE